ncbi:protein TESPA1-like [Melospiza melodia melodia]|uniref:protein TESPA1-like n=1 Tax=Melospiza melodia melodia TaxID=1914991 RepID=UPI002FD61F5C
MGAGRGRGGQEEAAAAAHGAWRGTGRCPHTPGTGTPPAMEGPSVLGPCSWQRRRAWARHGRGCRSPEGERDQEEEEEEEEEEEAAAVPWEPPEPDRAVLEGRPCCRVRTRLQDCE